MPIQSTEAAKVKSRIEIFRYVIPHPQAFVPQEGGAPKVGGTPGEVAVRLEDEHGIWESSVTLRDALKQLMRSCKIAGRPYFIEDYEVVFVDTVRCNAFWADGREIHPGRSVGV
jgi:hypothetical protein